VNGFTEPLEQNDQKPNEAGKQGVLAPLLTIDPLACTQNDQEQAKRGQGRMT
jgi:hypothetical protein